MTVFLAVMLIMAGGVADNARAARKNPCSKNPCAAINPCAMKNPCAAKQAGAQNKPIRKYRMTDQAKVLKLGEKLWNDPELGKSGSSCATCHPGGALLNSKPYPKYIGMADDVLTLDQMINFCMKNPMQAKPLEWNSQNMTALAAYVTANSGGEANPSATNPCNPCAGKNPCNPCGAR